jgi:light-regulated signal transduction histidine kinase (bacteriophytochrome)
MNQLINDLLEFAQIGRADLRKRTVNMENLVKSVVEDYEPQLRNRNVAWKIGELAKVHGDPDLLRWAVANLIDNALKYSQRKPDTCIRVDMLPDPSPEGENIFFVQDNGCGFDMSQAKDLFEPFQRLHSNNEYEGTGIGLANVQKIIQRHAGTIWFESEPGKGATFYFTLPGVPTEARFTIPPSGPNLGTGTERITRRAYHEHA